MGQQFSLLRCSYGKHKLPQRWVTLTIVVLISTLMYMAKFMGEELFVMTLHKATYANYSRRATSCQEAMTLNNTILGEPPREINRSFVMMSAAVMFCSVLGMFPSGICADLFGGRHVLLFGFMGQILSSFIKPSIVLFASEMVQILVRGVSGFFEGFVIAVLYNILAHWACTRHITLATTVLFNGKECGDMISIILLWYMKFHAQLMLYIVSIIELILYVVCIYYVFSRPDTHPAVSEEEKAIFVELFPKNELPGGIPWKAILTDYKIWALCACNVAYNWHLIILQVQFDNYLYYILFEEKLDILKRFSISMRATNIFTSICLALLADYNNKVDYIPIVYIRSTYIGIALIVAQFFSVSILFVGCSITAVDVLARMNSILNSALNASLRANGLENSRHYAGTVCALTFGVGQITRGMLWIAFGQILNNQSYAEWYKSIWLNCAVCMFCAVMHFEASRGERAPWDIIKAREDKRRMRATNVIV